MPADLPFLPCNSYFSPRAVPRAHSSWKCCVWPWAGTASRSICTVLWGLILNLPCQSPTSFLELQNAPTPAPPWSRPLPAGQHDYTHLEGMFCWKHCQGFSAFVFWFVSSAGQQIFPRSVVSHLKTSTVFGCDLCAEFRSCGKAPPPRKQTPDSLFICHKTIV